VWLTCSGTLIVLAACAAGVDTAIARPLCWSPGWLALPGSKDAERHRLGRALIIIICWHRLAGLLGLCTGGVSALLLLPLRRAPRSQLSGLRFLGSFLSILERYLQGRNIFLSQPPQRAPPSPSGSTARKERGPATESGCVEWRRIG
jgi:hypothetical protein